MIMERCEGCGHALGEAVKFCPECGARRGAKAPVKAAPPSQKVPKKILRRAILGSVLGIPVWVGIYFLAFSGDGCSSAEGRLMATALPGAGALTFVPKRCRSGQHMSFAGVALFEQKGAAPVVTLVQSHIEPPHVLIDPPGCSRAEGCRLKLARDRCQTFESAVRRTSTVVNGIRLLDGHLRLACKLPGGAAIDADIRFKSCD
jgi:hypothetical protein